MNDLIRFVTRNPILLIIIVGWVLSAIASARRTAQKQAAQRQARGERNREMGASPQARAPGAGPPPRSSEDIASAIRRAMGLDTSQPVEPQPQRRVETRPQPRVMDYDEMPQRARVDYDEMPQRVRVEYDPTTRRGRADGEGPAPRRSLRQEMADKDDVRRQEDRVQLDSRRVDLGGRVRDRHLELHVRGGDMRAHRRRPIRRVIDLSRPAQAFVAGEVFGKPVSLRDGWIGASLAT